MRGLGLLAAIGIAVGVVLVGLLLLREPSNETATPRTRATAEQRREIARQRPSEADEPLAAPAEAPPAIAEPPRSLRGTRPSGGLEVDASGHFFPTPDALLFFEYFLSASHEEPVPQLVARMRGAIRERLEPPADAEAEAFLESYLGYLDAGARRFDDPALAEGADLERRLQWVRELRREHFGAELAERLFREEEDSLAALLEMRRLGADPALGDDERRERLAAAAERYPERARAARERASASVRHARQERALRDAGASAEEIHALRIEHFGERAAERLRALDAERVAWDERITRYRAERDAVAEAFTDPEQRAAEIERLRETHFSTDEIPRVLILDRIEERSQP